MALAAAHQGLAKDVGDLTHTTTELSTQLLFNMQAVTSVMQAQKETFAQHQTIASIVSQMMAEQARGPRNSADLLAMALASLKARLDLLEAAVEAPPPGPWWTSLSPATALGWLASAPLRLLHFWLR